MRDILAKLGQVVVNDIANKPIAPLHVDEVVRVANKCTVPPFGHKTIHGNGQSHSVWLQNERDDPWVGEAVTFSPFGDRCADGLCYLGRW